MFENKWRLAFFASLLVLALVLLISFYVIVDQGYTVTYMADSYTQIENDLETLVDIINTKSFDKPKLKKLLESHRFYEWMDFTSGQVKLERVILVFDKDDQLSKLEWSFH